MGFFDGWDGGSVVSRKTSHGSKKSSSHKSSKKSRSHSPERHRHSASTLEGLLGGGSSPKHHTTSSRGSFFGLGNSSSKSFFGGLAPTPQQLRPTHVQEAEAPLARPRLLRQAPPHEGLHAGHHAADHRRGPDGAPCPLRPAAAPGIERMLGIAAKTASGDSFGLMGEAVRMAGGMGSSGSNSHSTSHYDRGYDGDMRWERTTYQDEGWGHGWGGDSGWGSGFTSGFSKMFA
ncbi:hypothetical protein PG987_003577 [Apiospora arundinis]